MYMPPGGAMFWTRAAMLMASPTTAPPGARRVCESTLSPCRRRRRARLEADAETFMRTGARVSHLGRRLFLEAGYVEADWSAGNLGKTPCRRGGPYGRGDEKTATAQTMRN